MASGSDRKRKHCSLQYLLDVPLSTYEWTFHDWQRWAPDCMPDSLKIPHLDFSADHLQGSSDSPCLLNNDDRTTYFGLDEGAESGTFMNLDEEDAAVLVSEILQENHHEASILPVEAQVAANVYAEAGVGAGPLQVHAPPPLVPHLSNNGSAPLVPHLSNNGSAPLVPHLSNNGSALQRQRLPMFPEEGPLRNIVDMIQCRPCFLFSKKLTSTDTSLSQCRLSVPKPAVRKNFTRPLFSQEDINQFDSKEGLEVTAFDHNGEEYAMRFKLWKTCGTYILLGKWKEFLQNNKLQGKADVEVSIWAFRHPQTGRIVFLIKAS